MRGSEETFDAILFENPNFDYLDELGDEDLKNSILSLLIIELDEFINFCTNHEISNELSQLHILTHKLSSKFSILGMDNTFQFTRTLEKELQSEIFSLQKFTVLINRCKSLAIALKEIS